MATPALLDLIPILALSILGLLFLRALGIRDDLIEVLALCFPVGGGLFTWMVFVASWAGMASTLVSLSVLFLASVATLWIAIIVTERSGARSARGFPSHAQVWQDTRRSFPMMAVFGFFLVFACWLSIGRSYSTWDAAAIWAAKGYGIAHEGSIFAGEEWGAHRLSYPLNLPLMIASVKLVSGDTLPGSKAIFPIFLVSTMAICAAGLRRNGLGGTASALVALLVGTVPEVFYQGTIGYANVPLSFYLVSGTIASLEGLFRQDGSYHILGGLLLGLAAWTRVEGILYAFAVVVVLALAAIATRRRAAILSWLVPFCLIGGSWMLFYELHGASGSQAMGAVGSALESFGRGDLNLQEMRMIFGYFRRHIFDMKTWGMLFIVWLLLVLPQWRSLHPPLSPKAYPSR